MSKETVLKILNLIERDKSFKDIWDKNIKSNVEALITIMNTDYSLNVGKKDILDTINVSWIINNLHVVTGGTPQDNSLLSQHPSSGENLSGLQTKLQDGLVDVIKQIETGYERVMTMYTVAFYMGVLLVAISVIASLYYHSDQSTLILGGLGLVDIIASMIFKPAQDLQNSRGNLAQLYAANFNWINDVHNWNEYLNRSKLSLDINNLTKVSKTMMEHTEQMMRLIKLYCITPPNEPIKSKVSKVVASEKGTSGNEEPA